MKCQITINPRVASEDAITQYTQLADLVGKRVDECMDALSTTGAYNNNVRSTVFGRLTNDVNYLKVAVQRFVTRPDEQQHQYIYQAIVTLLENLQPEVRFLARIGKKKSDVERFYNFLCALRDNFPQSYRGRDIGALIQDTDGNYHTPNNRLRTERQRLTERQVYLTAD